jgi:uncharacterized protein (TIGR03067 family)
MATGTSFKQQCPSCEAMVPIRDPGLIGRKIDCPKCKYRFVVEEPEPQEEDEAPARKSDKGGKTDPKGSAKGGKGPKRRDDDNPDRPAKKKTGGGSGIIIIGASLGVVAVIAIAVCAYAFWPSGDSGSSSGGSSSPPGGVASTPTTPTPGEGQPGGATAPPPGEQRPATPQLPNVTNLLPNDTQTVVAYPLSVTIGSALKAAGIDEAEGGFRVERFRQQMGFGLDEVNRLITALNSKDDWVFTVLQTKKPYNQEAIKGQLRLTTGTKITSKTSKAYDIYPLSGDFDALGNLLLKFNKPREQFFVHFHDSNTIVFADQKPLEKFLQEDKKPELLSKDTPPPATAGGGAPDGPGGRPGMGPMTPGMGGRPGMGPMTPGVGGGPGGGPGMGPMTPGVGGGPGGGPGGAPGGAPGGGGDTPVASEGPVGSWLTVDPSLKALLDRIEKIDENRTTRLREPVSLITVAELRGTVAGPLTTAIQIQGKDEEKSYVPKEVLKPAVALINKAKALAAGLVQFDQSKASIILAIEYRDARTAEAEDKVLRPLLALLQLALRDAKEGLGLSVKLGDGQPSGGVPGFPGFPGTGGPGGIGEGSMMSPGAPGGISRPGPGMMIPGGSGGPRTPVPGGFTGGRPGVGGVGGGRDDDTGGTDGVTGGTGTTEEKDGTINLQLEAAVHVFTMELHLTEEAYKKLFQPAQEALQWVKVQSDLTSSASHVHDLANALKTYFTEKGQYPPGTMHRAPSADRGLAWRPDERLSWVAGLLPYFGDDYKEWKLDLDKSWKEGKNLFVAGRIIPSLVSPRTPETGSTVISYPGVHQGTVAATHFVAMAGVGLDAAEFKAGDPATEKKIGMFGYDRIVKKADVKDGMQNTIALIMVPGDHKAPWLAGGGATVRAVSDDAEDARPIAPFVCCVYPDRPGAEKTKWSGKRGTIAIMADFRVRFIPADIPADMFRAMCTIAGGERIEKLDSLCPVIDEPEKREVRTEVITSRPATGGTDLDRLQGAWVPVAVETNGVKFPDALLKSARFTIAGTSLTAQMGGQVEKATITVDPTKTPRTIDLLGTEGMSKGKKQPGIYELNGDQLKLCFAKEDAPDRPTSFTSLPGSFITTVVLKRATEPAAKVDGKVTWKDFTPLSGTFTARFPGEVGDSKQEVPLPTGGKLNVFVYMSLYGSSGGVCSVTLTEIPVAPPNPEVLLESTKGQVALGFGRDAKIKDENKITLGTHPGREWIIDLPGKGIVKVRVYIVGKQLFQLTAGPTPAIPEADVKTFFNSFKLGK